MPAAFAIEKGKAYPNGILPENMPRPIAGKMNKVPNFSNCANWQQCVALATQFGLVAQHGDLLDDFSQEALVPRRVVLLMRLDPLVRRDQQGLGLGVSLLPQQALAQ